jgi:Zinc dependent phospholipase C
MPSGNTHILLVKNLPDNVFSEELKAILDSGIYFLQAGAVAPDLPYASIADSDLFLSIQSELADNFHYEKTNQIPLLALSVLKGDKNQYSPQELRYAFAFFVGYMSHVVADGVMHPFVRDKVGDYKVNADSHRVLEMEIDVLFFHEITKVTGDSLELNYSKVFEELRNLEGYSEKTRVMQLFNRAIREVYNVYIEDDKISDWLVGLYTMFKAAGNDYPQVFRNSKIIHSYLTPYFNEIKSREEKILILNRPKEPNETINFLKKEHIHFIKECVPRFYEKFIPLVNQAYEYVYKNGPEITGEQLYEIDLDTGRPIAQKNNMNLIPTFWS